jgi:hypothetical protein
VKPLLLAFALLVANIGFAQLPGTTTPEIDAELKDQIGLEAALNRFQEGWNSGDETKVMAAFHPVARIAQVYEDKGRRAKIDADYKAALEKWGKIEKIEVRKLIARLNRYVVKVEYSKREALTGIFAARKGADGQWALSYMNANGNGEPELKE